MQTNLKFIMIMTLISTVIIGLCARLWVDDYCAWGDVTRYGDATTATVAMYNQWAGIYTHFHMRHMLFSLTPYFVMFVPLTIVLGVYGISRYISSQYAAKNALWALCACVVFIFAMPTPQNLYLSATSMTYTYGALAFSALAMLCFKLPKFYAPILFCLSFLAAGLSETPTIMAVIAFGLWAIYKWDRRVWALLVGTAVGLVVVYLSPGNAVRAEALGMVRYATSENAPYIVVLAFASIIKMPFVPQLAIALVLCFALGTQLTLKPQRNIYLIRALLGSFIVLMGGIIPSFIYKASVTERTYLPFWWLWCVLAIYIGAFVNQRLKRHTIGIWGVANVGLLCTYVLISNAQFLPSALTYARSFDERHALLLASEGHVTVKPLEYDWWMKEAGGIVNDPMDWVNQCAKHAYGLDSITIK